MTAVQVVHAIPAMTLWQPWASLIAVGAKRYETRGRPPPSRLVGRRIAIHAAARLCLDDLPPAILTDISTAFGRSDWTKTLPRGAVVCTALLAEGLPVERVSADSFGDYTPGRWAWRLEDVRRLVPPAPARGMQTWGWQWTPPEGVF